MKTGTKKFLCTALTAAMVLPMVACGSNGGNAGNNSNGGSKTAKVAGLEKTEVTDGGKVLNIAVWNDEFKSRITDHYKDYEKIDETHGKIGDVKVHWIIKENKNNAYQNMLDKKLVENLNKDKDERIDMFLIEADYALKYVDENVNVALKLSDLGITEDDLSKQYQYTKDIVKDGNGDMRAASWQACSAGLIYNREIAKKVLGTDDPEEVQKSVSDWSTFNATAKKMKEAGVKITATSNDTYRVYSNNVSAPWVKDGKVQIDENIEKWAKNTKELVDAEETTTADLWSDDWSAGFKTKANDVFCYFGPAWLINFSMGNAPGSDKGDDGSIAYKGGWGFTNGPQGYYWGGSWICGANGTDNKSLVKDIILKMTTDDEVMKEIATKDSDCVNNKTVLEALASSEDGNNKVLGGQNPYKELAAGADKVDMSKISKYDQGCNEEFQKAMKNYFDGKTDYDGAIKVFQKAIVEKYPELK